MNINDLTTAYTLGMQTAVDSLTGLTPYIGAMPAADAAGYPEGHEFRAVYIAGYMKYVPSSITLDDTGMVVRY